MPSASLRTPSPRRPVRAALSSAALLVSTSAAQAQPAAPITVVPPAPPPLAADPATSLAIPETGALQPPEGSERLEVTVGDVTVEGGFPDVARETSAAIEPLKGRRVTLAEIYSAAASIEAAHARKGYILARVAVPPQTLADGAPLRIVVVDGFIEAIDTSALPPAVRRPVERRVAGLIGKRRVTLRDIETPLLLAGEVPGLALRSTLMRGTRPGGTRLALEGAFRSVGGAAAVDNALDPSLGSYGASLQFTANSAFGFGEQLYAFAYTGHDPARWIKDTNPVRVLGTGVRIPVGNGDTVINPEATFWRTHPRPTAGAPQTVGTLQRIGLRAVRVLDLTRRSRSDLSIAVEQMRAANIVPAAGADISRERYFALRLERNWTWLRSNGARLGVSVGSSQGLGNLGAISRADSLAAATPFSRDGARNDFTKVTLEGQALAPAGPVVTSVRVKAQTTFTRAIFRSEQFALEGGEQVSAFIGGATSVDEGVAARLELSPRVPLSDRHGTIVSPYVFAAAGTGRVVRPTVVETPTLSAGAAGAGARVAFGGTGLSLSLEYAHGVASQDAISGTDRANLALSFRF